VGRAEGGENGREVVRLRMPLADSSLRFWLGVGVSEARMPQGSSAGIGGTSHRATRKTPSTAMSLTVDIVLGHNIVVIERDIV